MPTDCNAERTLQLLTLKEVLAFLVAPQKCYYSFIENYFEHDSTPKTDCGIFCLYCLGKVAGFTKRIHRKQIVSVILDSLLDKTNVTCKAFIKALKANKTIYLTRMTCLVKKCLKYMRWYFNYLPKESLSSGSPTKPKLVVTNFLGSISLLF